MNLHGRLGVPSWHPPLLPAAGGVGNVLLLLQSVRVAAVYLLRNDAEGHIACAYAVGKVPGGDAPLTGCGCFRARVSISVNTSSSTSR
jgi:hypothetical protein